MVFTEGSFQDISRIDFSLTSSKKKMDDAFFIPNYFYLTLKRAASAAQLYLSACRFPEFKMSVCVCVVLGLMQSYVNWWMTGDLHHFISSFSFPHGVSPLQISLMLSLHCEVEGNVPRWFYFHMRKSKATVAALKRTTQFNVKLRCSFAGSTSNQSV